MFNLPQNATDNKKGKVLANKPADRVFVYYSDHGAPGILGMPSGPFLYADQLHEVVGPAQPQWGRCCMRRGAWAVEEYRVGSPSPCESVLSHAVDKT